MFKVKSNVTHKIASYFFKMGLKISMVGEVTETLEYHSIIQYIVPLSLKNEFSERFEKIDQRMVTNIALVCFVELTLAEYTKC